VKAQTTILLLFGLLLAGCGGAAPDGSAPREADILFHDDFSTETAGEWLTESDSFGSSAIVNQQLVIELNAPNVFQYVALEEQQFGDSILEVDATMLAGALESSYGVLLRLQEGGQFYRFEITGSGLFVVERRDAGGSWVRLVEEWTPSPAIKQGLNATNHFRVVADGSDFAFYVNEELLYQFSDPTLPAGAIALDAGTFGQVGLQVAFDNLYILRR
jgi:hypothetical protein